mmetsp:Transcript_87730/g.256437  ORF Transcript_87730/g.256437 Transcript_87730/m.256437 type:complete len:226 (+) Transcript_87730:524-1201(+)
MMTNSSSSQSTSWIVMSGSGFTMFGALKSLSPRLLETARPTIPEVRRFWGGRMARQTPATSTTEPPSASMRFFSAGRLGLWSSVSRRNPPLAFTRTARESPALARKRRRRISSSGPKIVMVHAVEPEQSPTRRACCRKLCSVCRNPPNKAVRNAISSLAVLVRSLSLASTFFARCAAAYSAQYPPPCPSKTPKKTQVAVSPRTLIGSLTLSTAKSSHSSFVSPLT